VLFVLVPDMGWQAVPWEELARPTQAEAMPVAASGLARQPEPAPRRSETCPVAAAGHAAYGLWAIAACGRERLTTRIPQQLKRLATGRKWLCPRKL